MQQPAMNFDLLIPQIMVSLRELGLTEQTLWSSYYGAYHAIQLFHARNGTEEYNTQEPIVPAPTPTPEPDPKPTPDEQPEPEQPDKQSGGNMGMLLLVGAVVLIGGGAAWYFKIYRPKHEPAEPEEDYDEADFEDGDALWDEDGEQESGDEEEPTE